MPQIGPLEILVVAAVALIVFGPQRLPEITRRVGRTVAELRRMANEVKSEFEVGLDDDEDEADEGTEPAPNPKETRAPDGDVGGADPDPAPGTSSGAGPTPS